LSIGLGTVPPSPSFAKGELPSLLKTGLGGGTTPKALRLARAVRAIRYEKADERRRRP
jgi:hypothetical protein